jgi:DNA repair exonuclease SbcCD nuclease subunit
MLEALAEEMKLAMELQKKEKEIIDAKLKKLEERDKEVPAPVKDEIDQLKQDGLMKSDLPNVISDVEKMLTQKFTEMEENRLIAGNNKPTIQLPEPVNEEVRKSKEMTGDDEYWLQNVTAEKGSVSDFNGERDKSASEIQFIDNITA